MHIEKRHLLAAVATLLGLSAGIASAAPVAWTIPAGSQTDFSYSNGQSLNGASGTGIPTGTGFFTSPSGLLATAAGSSMESINNSGSASDTLSVILNASPSKQFGSISTQILGDFVTNGLATVGANGQLRVYNLDNLAAGPAFVNVDFGTSFASQNAVNFNGTQGEFVGTAALALPDGWQNIRVELDSGVNANALFGSSLIQAKDISIDVATENLTTTEVPLPAAVFAAPVVAMAAWRMRRKLGLGK